MKVKGWIQKIGMMSLLPMIYLAFLSCTDSGKKIDETARNRSQVSAHLAHEPSEAYQEINLHIAKVKLGTQDGKVWEPLINPAHAEPHALAGGPPQCLTSGTPLPRRQYRKCWLQLDARSTVTPKGGSAQPLRLAEPLRAGITLDFPAGSEGKDYDLFIVVDAARCIQRTRDASGQFHYTLRPGLRIVDRNAAGSLAGRITDATGTPCAGIEVTAQTRTAHGAVLARSARTGADGGYRLDLLPMSGDPRHVVCLPGLQPATQHRWKAEVSPAFVLSGRDRDLGFDGKIQPADGLGRLHASIAQAADPKSAHDEIEVLQDLPMGPGQPAHPFLVRVALAEQNHDGSAGNAEFSELPAGHYLVRRIRCTLDSAGKAALAPSEFTQVQVAADQTANVAL